MCCSTTVAAAAKLAAEAVAKLAVRAQTTLTQPHTAKQAMANIGNVLN